MSVIKQLWKSVCSIFEGDDTPRAGTGGTTICQPTKPDLSNLKLVELKAIAKDRGLKGVSQMRKADMIRLLEEN